MLPEFRKSEENGRFILFETARGYDLDGDSIGTCGSETITCFQSAEGREYYIQMREARERTREAERRLESLQSMAAGILTPKGRIRRKQVMKLIEALK